MKILRIVAAVMVGFALGSLVNMLLITVGSDLIPAPAGVDPNDMDSLKAGIHLFGPEHFLFPFLAHSGGTFTAALTAFLLASEYKIRLAWVLGSLNLLGGIAAATLIPAPMWFITLDLLLAYLPMAYLATLVGERLQPVSSSLEN